MTIATSASSQTLAGDGLATTFAFGFVAGPSTNNLTVTYTDADGNDTLLSPSLYGINLNPVAVNALWAVGGTVSYPLSGSAISTGTSITITRVLPLLQQTTISNQGGLWPQVVERALDYQMMCVQQNAATLDRAIVAPPEDIAPDMVLPPAAERANSALIFDEDGNVAVGEAAGAPVSSAMQPVVASTTIPAARSRMGMYNEPGIISTGSANAQSVSYSTPPSAYNDADEYTFIPGPGLTNTGATTLAITPLTAKAAEYNGGSLASGSVVAGQAVAFRYDSASDTLQIMGPIAPGSGAGVTGPTTSVVSSVAFWDATDGSALKAGLTTGATGSVLTAQGAGNMPAWASPASAASVPVGTVCSYAGASAPSGWLLCFGQAINRTTYSALFSVISTAYGVGDGSTTFNLPDCRGRTAVGRDDMGGTTASRVTSAGSGIDGVTLGASGGTQTHTLVVGEMPSHAHTAAGNFIVSGGGGAVSALGAFYQGVAATNASGGNGPHQNMPPAIILNTIIYTSV